MIPSPTPLQVEDAAHFVSFSIILPAFVSFRVIAALPFLPPPLDFRLSTSVQPMTGKDGQIDEIHTAIRIEIELVDGIMPYGNY